MSPMGRLVEDAIVSSPQFRKSVMRRSATVINPATSARF